MSISHNKKAGEFLKKGDYVSWHDDTFWSVRKKRDAISAKIPEWEQLRNLASQIKQHTLSHLDEYLVEFTDNLERNGVTVHWADDAGDFNRIVLDILRGEGVKKMVKSKSMLTEECGMNPYLETH